jgi:hypothetical protein
MLRDGRIHLSGIRRLAPHLTLENRDWLLKRATHRSRREIEELIAELAPRPDAAAWIRKLPQRRAPAPPSTSPGMGLDPVAPASPLTGSAGGVAPNTGLVFEDGAPAGPALGARPVTPEGQGLGLDPVGARATRAREARMEPLAPARYKVQFTADVELRDKLERLQALMRSSVPDGDLARIINVAVTEKLERLEAKRFAKTKKARKTLAETDTRPKSRYIPAAVRRITYERDGGRCTYRDEHGRRCTRRHDLEFHHHGTPFGRGGPHSPDVVRLMCKAHNALMAEEDYGKEVMARFQRTANRVSAPAALIATGSRLPQRGSAPG